MVYRLIAIIIAILSIILVMLALNVGAVDMKITGLTISPTRQNMTVTANELANGSFQITNALTKPLTINLSVKQFSAKNYTYDYAFSAPKDDWIKLEQTQVVLQPGQKKQVRFTANVPSDATPGGHYFAFFASSDLTETGVRQTAQVVSLLYTTVTGRIVQAGSIDGGSAPFLVIGDKVSYSFNAKNTGNIDFSALFFGRLDGLFGKVQQSGVEHELLPGTIRTVGGSVPAPLLPGIYKLTYGYKKDSDNATASKTTYILYAPLWSIATVIVLAVVGLRIWRARHGKAPENI